jgi:hypothetical protein
MLGIMELRFHNKLKGMEAPVSVEAGRSLRGELKVQLNTCWEKKPESRRRPYTVGGHQGACSKHSLACN